MWQAPRTTNTQQFPLTGTVLLTVVTTVIIRLTELDKTAVDPKIHPPVLLHALADQTGSVTLEREAFSYSTLPKDRLEASGGDTSLSHSCKSMKFVNI